MYIYIYIKNPHFKTSVKTEQCLTQRHAAFSCRGIGIRRVSLDRPRACLIYLCFASRGRGVAATSWTLDLWMSTHPYLAVPSLESFSLNTFSTSVLSILRPLKEKAVSSCRDGKSAGFEGEGTRANQGKMEKFSSVCVRPDRSRVGTSVPLKRRCRHPSRNCCQCKTLLVWLGQPSPKPQLRKRGPGALLPR